MAAQFARFFRSPSVRFFAFIALLGATGMRGALHSQGIRSEEMWWHLSTGLWIIQHHAVPQNGMHSLYSNLPWVDGTWGFDLLFAAAYKLLGLRAIAFITASVRMLFAVSMFLVAGGRRNFWLSFTLAGLVQFIFPDLLPLPISISMALFALELALLLRWRESGDDRALYWLAAIFVVWGNVHTQFALGVIALAFFVLSTSVQNWLAARKLRFPASRPVSQKLLIVSVLCLLATAINPYGIRVWQQIIPSSYSDVAFSRFADLHPLGFRQPQDYLLVLLAMAAFLLVGRTRGRDLLAIVLLVVAICAAFRMQRDAWILAVAAVFVIGDYARPLVIANDIDSRTKWETPGLAIAALLLLVSFVVASPSQQQTTAAIEQVEPVKASDYIRGNHLPQPLFNNMQWGGFLTWYLPEYPVSVDSRINLYGSDTIEEYFKTVNGGRRLEAAPLFADAQTILAMKGSALQEALTTFPDLRQQYAEIYSDDQASVFVKK